MMDGKNSTGRKVSLLNDDDCVATAAIGRLPPLSIINHHHHNNHYEYSRSPSCASSTPSLSPQTPQLVRSESSDSRGLPSSPLTPQFPSFDNFHHPKFASQPLYLLRPSSFTKMDDHNAPSMYPPVPDASGVMPYPMPPATTTTHPPASFRNSHSPVSESSCMPNPSASATKAAPKKNQYPCPLAKAFNCSDFFTTSGHAARHAKKHTGKKDAFCPECNKAFTRKDNMEQHRRTHQNMRGPSKPSTDNNKVKKPVKPSTRKADKPLPPPLEAAALAHVVEEQHQQHMAQASMMPQGPYFINADPVQALPQPVPTDFHSRQQLYRSGYDFIPPTAPMMPDTSDMQAYSYPSPGLSNGLDTLALAASDHRRMSNEDSS